MITLQALQEQLALYRGWIYSHDASYPSALPGVRGLRLSPPSDKRQCDCCTFVEGLVIGAAVRSGAAVEWSQHFHARAMVAQLPRDQWGPVEALVDAGLATPLEAGALPPPWSVLQGWRGSRGHTFVVADSDADLGNVLVLEANSAYGLTGPGYRAIGPLAGGAPELGARDPRCWTWSRVRMAYPELRGVALRLAT